MFMVETSGVWSESTVVRHHQVRLNVVYIVSKHVLQTYSPSDLRSSPAGSDRPSAEARFAVVSASRRRRRRNCPPAGPLRPTSRSSVESC